jgi:hypothetical protein
MHRLQRLLGWEYTRTYGPVGDWPGRDVPPPGAGWEVNVDYGDGGREVGRETQYTYWRRRKQPTGLVRRDDYGG